MTHDAIFSAPFLPPGLTQGMPTAAKFCVLFRVVEPNKLYIHRIGSVIRASITFLLRQRRGGF